HHSVPETDRVIGVSQIVGARAMRWLHTNEVCLEAPQKGRRQHWAEAPPNFSSRQCTSVEARQVAKCHLAAQAVLRIEGLISWVIQRSSSLFWAAESPS